VQDYGARLYNPAIGRWLSLDPLMKKYPNMSPYIFTANNPVIYVDYDGKDFILKIEGNKMTISATYYIENDEKMIKQVNNAISYINSHSDKFKFTDKDGNIYDIKFNLKSEIKETEDEAESAALSDDSGNFIKDDGGFPLDVFGTMGSTKKGGDLTLIANANNAPPYWKEKFPEIEKDPDGYNTEVIKHEILHTLGVDHKASGERGTQITESVVKGMLRYAGQKNLKKGLIEPEKSKGFSMMDNKKLKKNPDYQPKVKIDTGKKDISKPLKGKVEKNEKKK
jgi:hypothetical protein